MIDILFPVHNRVEFTKVAADALARHTNKSLVRLVYIYDDKSVDGAGRQAYRILRSAFKNIVIVSSFQGFGGPVAIMNDYLRQSTVEMFAKIDNDTVVCPQWLDICYEVMRNNSQLDLLGIEPHSDIVAPGVGRVVRGAFAARFIGGIGLMRTRVFRQAMKPLVQSNKYFGFTSWQTDHEMVSKGWLHPALPITLLDRIPVMPWSKLSVEYIARGWQRPYGVYHPISSYLWEDLKLIS
jgi:hypothetical protein